MRILKALETVHSCVLKFHKHTLVDFLYNSYKQ